MFTANEPTYAIHVAVCEDMPYGEELTDDTREQLIVSLIRDAEQAYYDELMDRQLALLDSHNRMPVTYCEHCGSGSTCMVCGRE